MTTEQWTDEEWREFQARLEDAETEEEFDGLLDLTRGQEEHPEWYDSSCICQLCYSYGDQ